MAWLDDPDIIRFDSEHEREIYNRGTHDMRREIIKGLRAQAEWQDSEFAKDGYDMISRLMLFTIAEWIENTFADAKEAK